MWGKITDGAARARREIEAAHAGGGCSCRTGGERGGKTRGAGGW